MSMLPESYPFITIGIPVKNEERYITNTLNQLLAPEYPKDKYEIIISDGLSTDRTPEIVKEIAANKSNVYIYTNNKEKSGPGRNIAFKEGKGDYFVIIDGHCLIPDKNFIKNIAYAFVNNIADCIGRPQPFILPEKESWERAIGLARMSPLGHSSNSNILDDFEGFVSPVSVGCGYSKIVFKNIGYVDENFDACEDVEFNYRVEKAGFKTFLHRK